MENLKSAFGRKSPCGFNGVLFVPIIALHRSLARCYLARSFGFVPVIIMCSNRVLITESDVNFGVRLRRLCCAKKRGMKRVRGRLLEVLDSICRCWISVSVLSLFSLLKHHERDRTCSMDSSLDSCLKGSPE